MMAFFAIEWAAGILLAQWPVLLRLVLAGAAMILVYLAFLALVLVALGIPPKRAWAELTGRAAHQSLSAGNSEPHG